MLARTTMRMRTSGPILPICSSLVLVACAADSAGLPSNQAPVPSSAEPSPSSEPPSITFAWPDGAAPTVTRQLAGLDERYINPGAIIESDGTLHMFANLFTAWPGRVRIQHLVSSDGAKWTLAAPEPAIDSQDVPLGGLGADVSTGFVTDNGTWVLIFETVSSLDPWVLGRATAPTPDGPWTIDSEPILEGGPEGTWDAGGLAWPSVVRTQNGYAMYYTATARPGGDGMIGLAESTDGVTWTKRDAPVLEPLAEWEGGSLDRPRVAMTPVGMVMVYAGADLTNRGLAWSSDGVSWRRDGDVPVITQDDFPVEGKAWDAALLNREGALIYYLEIGTASGSAGTQVYRAEAELPER
jgi:predicted GH43/DUF377 family glycosyl hydrolase